MTDKQVQSPKHRSEITYEPLQFTIQYPQAQNVIGVGNLKRYATQMPELLNLTVVPVIAKRIDGEIDSVVELEPVTLIGISSLKQFAERFKSEDMIKAQRRLAEQNGAVDG
jgi:hypothetical protein